MNFFDKYIFTYGQSIFNKIHSIIVAPLVFIHTRIRSSKTLVSDSQSGDLFLVAHRGVNTHPSIIENTGEAFKLAWQTTQNIEFDLRMTIDGEIVIHHDSNLQRLWGLSNVISKTPLAELKIIAPQILTLNDLIASETQRQKEYQFDNQNALSSTWFVEIKTEEDSRHLIQLLNVLKKLLGQLSENKAIRLKVILISLSDDVMAEIKTILSDYDRSMVYLLNKEKALGYIQEDLECGLLGWYFNMPKIEHNNIGIGFLNHKSSYRYYQIKNEQRIYHDKKPVWLFSDRVDLF